MSVKDKQLIFRCFECKNSYRKDLNKELIKRFKNICEFCNEDISKFVLLLRKGVYPYEYMDSWERFDETLLPDKKAFYSSLNMEDITDVDRRHANNVFKNFKLKHLGEYHDLYVQSDTLLLAEVFGNFRNMCIEIYELDPTHFLSTPGLAWKACLRKTRVELELITNIGMLVMVEKGSTGGICHAVYRYAKANNKYMKNYDEAKESSFILNLDINNLYGWAMCQKLSVNAFKWVRNVSKIDKDSIKNYDEDGHIGYFQEKGIEYPRELQDLHSDLPFLPKRMKINKCYKLVCNLYDKKTVLSI